MKCIIPEISWHNRDPVLTVDIQLKKGIEPFYRLASGGTDSHVLIWHMLVQSKGEIKLDCVSDLSRHQKSVNAVKFSPSGEFLASADDESVIIVWKQRTDVDAPDLDSDEDSNPESWIQLKILRGHLNDVFDLCWSPNSSHIISGSIDNTAVIWDVPKGKKVAILPEAKNFVQGVTWDPDNNFVATMSSDSRVRVYCWKSHRLLFTTHQCRHPTDKRAEAKPAKLFHDDTLKTFFRRLDFSPDGQLLAVPTGVMEQDDSKPTNVTWLFPRKQFNKAILCYPHGSQASTVTRWCPLKFKLREESKPVINLPYRMVLAIATKSSVFLYDTQHAVPVGLISNIHYTNMTDMTWSSDGRLLVTCSTDGYCSMITFSEGELGDPYNTPESNPI